MIGYVILAVMGLLVLRLFGVNWASTKVRRGSALRVTGVVLGVIALLVLWIALDIRHSQQQKEAQAQQIRDAQTRLQQSRAGK